MQVLILSLVSEADQSLRATSTVHEWLMADGAIQSQVPVSLTFGRSFRV